MLQKKEALFSWWVPINITGEQASNREWIRAELDFESGERKCRKYLLRTCFCFTGHSLLQMAFVMLAIWIVIREGELVQVLQQ
jgi:hypothetical protein